MKILLMTTKMDAGGAERYLYEHIKYMDRSKMQIDYYLMYYADSQEMKKNYEELGVCIFERRLEENGGKGSFAYIKDMRNFYKLHGSYDVIHVNGTVPILQFCAMYAAKRAGVRMRIAHSHNDPEEKKDIAGFINKLAKKGTCCFATDLFACSRKAGVSKFGKKGVMSSKFRVMKNGIDTKRFSYSSEIREKVRMKNGWSDSFVVMHVGRLSKEKNQIFLIKIIEEISKECSEIKLVLIGDGPDRRELAAYVKKSDLEHVVEFKGNQKEVEQFLQGADVFCLPSYTEGFPIAGLEAESMGIYCVVSKAVPPDWNFTGRVKYLSLTDSIVLWKDAIMRGKGIKRTDTSDLLRKKGYDIRDTAQELQRLYEMAL